LHSFWKRKDELEHRLRHKRPPTPAPLLNAVLQRLEGIRTRRERSYRLGLAGALSVAMLVILGTFGGLGYAKSSVRHAVKATVHVVSHEPGARHDQGDQGRGENEQGDDQNEQGDDENEQGEDEDEDSSEGEYGRKQAICAVQPNGKMHTIVISENAVPHYLRTHPRAFLGSCP
jgi:hypothetical protein